MSAPPVPYAASPAAGEPRARSDAPFLIALGVIGGLYLLLIVAMLVADAAYTSPTHIFNALNSEQIRYATWLSLISCSITTVLSLWVAVPTGYLLSRWGRDGGTRLRWLRNGIDAVLDVPIVLPPLVIGLSLLILFQTAPGKWIERRSEAWFDMPITYAVPSVIIAQFSVAAAFAVRTMRVTFDQINPRSEQVALTLGCTRAQAFFMVVLPEARRGILTAGTLAWARSLGEFGPILVFSGATRMRTEVLPTSVWLELAVGRIESAVAVSLLMVACALIVLVIVRTFGTGERFGVGV
jgi:molybdate transport system permease protein